MTITNNIAAATALICAFSVSSFAHAGAPAASGPMPLGAPAAPPQAYLEFCSRQPRDCQVSREMVLSQIETLSHRNDGAQVLTAAITRPLDTAASAVPLSGQAQVLEASFSAEPPVPEPAAAVQGATLVMDSHTWSTLNRVNTRVNRAIIRMTDIANNGVLDRWSTPLAEGTKFGDCEDYVLEKRRALIAEGFPPSALSIAVVRTPWNTGHAVLLVAGDKGEYVLDNLSPWIVPWNEAPYTFRKRQVAGDAFRWAEVETAPSTTDGVRSLLIARAD